MVRTWALALLAAGAAGAMAGTAGAAGDKPNIADGVWVTDDPEAKCLDGSPPIYYIRRAAKGSPNATKWSFHIQGGGWCMSLDSCLSRASTRLGSSKPSVSGDAPVRDLDHIEGCNNTRWCGAPMVNDEGVNPLAYDWNAVLLRYCDGGSWTGDNATSTTYKGSTLWWRGYRNLLAIFRHLLTHEGLDRATDVLLGGDSAGGMATYLHADAVFAMLPPAARKLAIPDSGFFLDYGSYATGYRWFFQQMNSSAGVSQACMAAQRARGQPVDNCVFPQHAGPFIQSRLWPLQSQYDPAQPNRDHSVAGWNKYGPLLLSTFNASILHGRPGNANGAWLYSCYQHCGGWEFDVQGTEAAWALPGVFGAGPNPPPAQQRVWMRDARYPCTACCTPPPSR